MAQEIADSKLLDTWSSSGTKIEPDISKIIEGWQLGEQPPHEYMNWLQNTFGSKLNHILKNGVAEWNNETEYLAGASVQHSGSIWLCKTTNTNSEPTGSNANWEKVAISKDLTVTVDTLSDLRSISYPAGTVWVSGYNTKNDGAFGSHIFRLKGVKTTETDNGGTVIIATIGGTDYVYELQYDVAVNVKWFGAVGDWNGVDNNILTDDTIAIQRAIDWCSLTRETLFIDPNVSGFGYSISNTLRLRSNLTIEGAGVIKNTSHNIALYADAKSNITIRDITVVGSRLPIPNSTIDGDKAIYFNFCTKILVENVVTRNTFAWGVIANICTGVKFLHLDCSDVQAQSCIAVTNGTSNGEIIGCKVYNSGLYGIEIEGLQAGGSNTKNIVVTNLDATDCYAGISIVRADNIRVENSNIYNNNTYNVFVEECSEINITNNIIIGSPNPVFMRDCLSGDINGNTIKLDTDVAVSIALLYYYIENASLLSLSDIKIYNNSFDCKGVNKKVIDASNPTPARIDFIGNTLSNIGSNIMTLRTKGVVEDNKVLTSYASTPSSNVSARQNHTKYRVIKQEAGNTLAVGNIFFDTDVILLGVSVKYSYNTAVSTDWRIYIGPSDASGTFIGTHGTPNTVYAYALNSPQIVAKNTAFPVSVKRSDNVYNANYIEVRYAFLELCN